MPQNKQKRDSYLGGNSLLPGSPGYRTRGGRSGLDPIDSPAEAAFIEAVFLVRVFKLQARTRNPFYLIAMFVFGVIPFVPLAVLTVGTITKFTATFDLSSIFYLLVGSFMFGVPMAITGALSLNFVLSILEILKMIPPLPKKSTVQSNRPEKKQPKRRKDYK